LKRKGGPRQPGGGRQTAGPRRHARHQQRDERGRPEPRDASRKPGHSGARAHQADGARGRDRWTAGKTKAPSLRDRPPPPPVVEAREAPPDHSALAAATSVQTVAVSPDETGMRVDRFLEARFPGLSFSHIQRVIRKGELRVNGKRVDGKDRLQAGQAVRIPPLKLERPKPLSEDAAADDKTRAFLRSITLHEDDDVLVLNKPMGLAVQGGSGTTRHLDGMLEVLRDKAGQRPRLVHRLDKDTAGCLLVAKTRFAATALAKNFRSRSARKIYWALVAGVPRPRQGRISTFLAKEEREDESFMRIAQHGEEGASHAVTFYAVVETAGPKLAWLSLKPVTGRTHQLRAHMVHIGHPIVGDPKYFDIENWELPGGLQNKLHLLARRIAIPHPRGGVIDVTAPLPPHMLQTWNLLGFDAKRYDPIVDAPEE
jgi:23S rRNA pseudouridine955/2504/2580 synthase